MKLWNKDSKLDEMQEQKLLHIEKHGCYIAFAGLVIILMTGSLAPGFYEKYSLTMINILFMGMCLYLLISSIRAGIWDRHLEPSLKNNLVISIIAGLAAGLVIGIRSYVLYQKLLGAVATVIITGLFIFGLCIAALTLSSAAYKKKHDDLEKDDEDIK